ncbi:hypothetical protein Tco_1092159 [Tanacetum coccineum]|uniref:Reverse transcriptase domain-containing protein n=1 Tax=Tanacetum coccineum TaxID=301880 RepID=A0ABQ5IA93_9ASTR
MCTYLKNMEGKKVKDLKNKSFDFIQKMFDRAFMRVNTFVDFRTDLVEGSSKRAGEELEQESTKKQNADDEKDTIEFQSLMEVIPDEKGVAIDVVPLAIKSPKIVGWKIHKEGNKSYYQIIRADGKSQMYKIFSQMLKSFSREDLEDLYKLLKAKYESTRSVYAEQEASGVNAASEEVSTAELVSTAYQPPHTFLNEWHPYQALSIVMALLLLQKDYISDMKVHLKIFQAQTQQIKYLYAKENNIQRKDKVQALKCKFFWQTNPNKFLLWVHTRASNFELVEPLPEPECTLNQRLRLRNRRVSFDQRNNLPQHPRIVYPPILNINYFRHFLDILRNNDPIDDEPMWAADRVVALTLGSAITILETENEFAIKGNHLTLVKGNQFDGRTKTDPHKHIYEFLRICDMFKYRDTENEAVHLMMFPLSLTREAKTWLDELNEGTIETWDELRTAFIS